MRAGIGFEVGWMGFGWDGVRWRAAVLRLGPVAVILWLGALVPSVRSLRREAR